MSVAWLHPWVWLAGALVAVPIAIHLLARDRSRPVPFPSLRFLERTPLSAVARHRLQDIPLLLVRMAIVLLAVAALAGPILITPGRQAAWATHVARAVVSSERTAPAEDELRTARVGQSFSRERVRDAVADAVRWLGAQGPATKEIVVLSSFRRGEVDAADFAGVPDGIAIRLERTGEAASVREREISRLQLRGNAVNRVTERLSLGADTTGIVETRTQPVPDLPISVSAAPEDRRAADAGLRAVLRRGLRLPPSGLLQRIEVAWPGEAEGLARAIDAQVAAPLDDWEPEFLNEAELAVMARPAAPVAEGTPVDEGDRRRAWGLVLILIGLETWMRGRTWT